MLDLYPKKIQFKAKRPHYEFLRKKWIAKNKALREEFVDKHLRRVALGSLGGLLLLPTPGLVMANPTHLLPSADSIQANFDTDITLSQGLHDKVPEEAQVLTPDQEQTISTYLSSEFHMQITPQIDGIRLNRTYGLIGGEQHLYRYPGDTLYAHAKDARDWAMFGGSGIAPGLGAWGYFAPSKAQFSAQDEERERWYIAVQTFLSPGFAENVAKYSQFYKYRKMLVVNPKTGQAVVADIADSGPSAYTGKQLGGSPEVMDALGLGSGPRKGGVLYFFINDPSDTIPLGPVKIPQES